MSAGIMDKDTGFVWGTTWHNNPRYIQLDRSVTGDEAASVMNYPMAKCQLFDEDMNPVEGAYCLKRTDHNIVLVPMVGEKFVVENNINLFNFVSENLLASYPDLEIESVGTLFNGQVCFLNLKVSEMNIRGDNSPSINRLMYYNPLGKGSYAACAHNIRIVCNNTLRAAVADGAANQSIVKFRHTKSAKERINAALEQMAEIKLGLKKFEVDLESLINQPVQAAYVGSFCEKFFPIPIEEGRGQTMMINKKDEFMAQFESDQGLESWAKHTKYGLLQAFTFCQDHGKIKNGDVAALAWDGMVGVRAASKEKALAYLMA